MKRQAVLLVNLGSPDSPAVPDVRRYLAEFLMDKRVIDAPWPIRAGIVYGAILPRRPHQSSEAYQSIWWREGSPLIVISRRLQESLQARLDVPVELAMRYQNPSIPDAIDRLRGQGIEEVVLVPLFPHYAMSSYETAVERVVEVARQQAPGMVIKVVPPYFEDPGFIEALVERSEPYLREEYDHLLFSYHGIPERHLRKSDTTGCHCLKVQNCCEVDSLVQRTCYRSQCFKTTRAFVRAAGIPAGKYSVSFQSRLGRDPWLTPFTDAEIERLAREGKRRILVMCPAFVSDCLETLEEIAVRGRETFVHAGGRELIQIPCLNDHPRWIGALEALVERHLGAVAHPSSTP